MSVVTSDGNYSVDVPQVNDSTDRDRFGTLINAILESLPSWLRTRIDDMNFADFDLSRPVLKDYTEEQTSPSSSSGTLTLDIENGNHFATTLTENVTTLTISNPAASGTVQPITIKFTQDGIGSWTVAFPASFKWSGGSAPTITATAGAVDWVSAWTDDGGTTWYANVMGQAYS